MKKESWKKLCGHLSVKIAIAINIELIVVSFVLDVWSVLIR